MPADFGNFEMYGFDSTLTQDEIVVITKGGQELLKM